MQKATRLYPRSSSKLALAAARYDLSKTALASAFFDALIDSNGVIADREMRRLEVSEPLLCKRPAEHAPTT